MMAMRFNEQTSIGGTKKTFQTTHWTAIEKIKSGDDTSRETSQIPLSEACVSASANDTASSPKKRARIPIMKCTAKQGSGS
jgi:hypothetical protein